MTLMGHFSDMRSVWSTGHLSDRLRCGAQRSQTDRRIQIRMKNKIRITITEKLHFHYLTRSPLTRRTISLLDCCQVLLLLLWFVVGLMLGTGLGVWFGFRLWFAASASCASSQLPPLLPSRLSSWCLITSQHSSVFLTPSAIMLLTHLRSGKVTGAIVIADFFYDSGPELLVTDW
jgi:hypothetical protein